MYAIADVALADPVVIQSIINKVLLWKECCISLTFWCFIASLGVALLPTPSIHIIVCSKVLNFVFPAPVLEASNYYFFSRPDSEAGLTNRVPVEQGDKI